MLLTDFYKLKNMVDSEEVDLDYRVKLLMLRLEDLLKNFKYGDQKRYQVIFKLWQDTDKKIGFITGNTAGTIKNDRTIMNRCVEQYIDRRLVKDLKKLNNIIDGKSKDKMSEEQIEERLRDIFTQLNSAEQKYTSNIVTQDIVDSLGYDKTSDANSDSYTLLDLRPELDFVKAHTQKAIRNEISQLNPDKLRYILASLDNKVSDLGFKSHILDFVGYATDGNEIDFDSALDYYFNKSLGTTDSDAKTPYIDSSIESDLTNKDDFESLNKAQTDKPDDWLKTVNNISAEPDGISTPDSADPFDDSFSSDNVEDDEWSAALNNFTDTIEGGN